MTVLANATDTEQDRILSEFIGRNERWSCMGDALYHALSNKGVNIETASKGDSHAVTVTVRGCSLTEVHPEPYVALAEAAVKLLKFHKQAVAGGLSIAKANIPFSVAIHWLMNGLDARRKSWPKGQYISLEPGCIESKDKMVSFLPEGIFNVQKGVKVSILPRLVMMDGALQARSDWFASSVDIMATDWEAF
ncbi:MW1434 family type I TA system toxin [Escherichia coli]